MPTELKLPNPKKARRFFARKMAFTTGPAELGRWLKDGTNVNVVDVRAAEDYERGHIPGAVSLPKDRWRRLSGLDKDKINVVYCYSQVCHLAAAAALAFADRGFPVMELEGGFETWKAYGLPIEKSKPAQKKVKKAVSIKPSAQPAAPEPEREPEPQAAA